MYSTLLSYMPASVLLLLLGTVIAIKNHREKAHVSFSAFVYTIGAWLTVLCFADLSHSERVSLWLIRLAAALGSLMLPLFMHFCLSFPTESSAKVHRLLLTGSIPSYVFAALSFTPLLIPKIEYVDRAVQPSGLGIAYTLQTTYLVIGYITCFISLVIKYRSLTKPQKSQVTAVISGLCIAVIANTLTGFVIAALKIGSSLTNAVGSFSVLIFATLTGYALFRYKLFSIRAGIVRSLAFVIALAVTVLALTGIMFVAGALFYKPLLDILRDRYEFMLIICIMATIGLLFNPLRRITAKVSTKVFLQESYDTNRVLEQLSSTLIRQNSLEPLASLSLELFTSILRPTHSMFIIWNKKQVFKRMTMGANVFEHTADHELYAISGGAAGRSVTGSRQELIATTPSSEHVELLLNLYDSKQRVGTILLGPKRNGKSYSPQDLTLLRIAGSNLGIAVSNALKYTQIQLFADTLEKEVHKATGALRKANEKLQALSDSKDEFMSIATHQIRPQLAAARGFIDVLEKTNMDEEQKDLLEWASTGIERSIRIIADLLNLSRFSSGTFLIDKQRCDLVKLLSNELRSLEPLTKAIGTTIFNTTSLPRAFAFVDEIKLREVIANLCNNAIQYSPHGSTIEVTLTEEHSAWTIEIRDYGIGVPKEDQKYLFNKFYRAQNARDERAAGTGIGLFLAKTVIDGHSGKIYYKTPKKGLGSIFGFTLPKEITTKS